MSAAPSTFEELKRSSQKSAVTSLLGVALVVIALLYSTVQLRSLKLAIDHAKAELSKANSQLLDRQDAIARLDKEINEKQIQMTVLNSVVTNLGSAHPKETGQAYRSALKANPGADEALPRIYFQLRSEEQRPCAQKVAHALIAGGFSIPEFEVMYPHGTVRTFLRHFQNSQTTNEDLARIVKILGSLNVTVEEQDFSGKESKDSAEGLKVRNYELWFGPEFGPEC